MTDGGPLAAQRSENCMAGIPEIDGCCFDGGRLGKEAFGGKPAGYLLEVMACADRCAR